MRPHVKKSRVKKALKSKVAAKFGCDGGSVAKKFIKDNSLEFVLPPPSFTRIFNQIVMIIFYLLLTYHHSHFLVANFILQPFFSLALLHWASSFHNSFSWLSALHVCWNIYNAKQKPLWKATIKIHDFRDHEQSKNNKTMQCIKRKYLIKLLKLREFHWENVLLKRLMWLFVLSRNWRSETVEASNSKHKLSKNWNWDCQFQKLISKVKLLILKLKLSHGKFNESRKSLKLNNNIGLKYD